jgi:hypothetical protein
LLFALITAGSEPADETNKGKTIFGSAFRQFGDSNVFGGLLRRATAARLTWSNSALKLAYTTFSKRPSPLASWGCELSLTVHERINDGLSRQPER